MKKLKLFFSGISIIVLSALFYVNEAKAIVDPGNGINCSCTDSGGSCAANGAGTHQCAPDGTAKCWKYNNNCK